MNLAAALAPRSRTPAKRYQEIDLSSRIESAAPHALVAMLYSELSLALDVMLRAADADDTARRWQQHERATSILLTLEASLDRNQGGDLATSLGTIYRQMRRHLLAGRAGDRKAIVDVRDGVASLAEAWNRIGP
jgi:flagellar secretion chaperone FliS